MIDKKKLAVSAGSSIIQTVVSGVTTFILFKFILATIGAEKLGIWSLVIAASSTVQVANLGMSGSIVKYVADCDAAGDKKGMSVVIQTTVISIALVTFALILGAYPAVKAYLDFALNAHLYREAVEILPIAMLAFLITMVAGIYQGALYGCQLIVHRNVILMTDSISYLVLCVVLMPRYGLLGLAYARLAQNCFTLLFSVVLLRRYIPQLPLFPLHWSKARFKHMFAYAANFQFISVLVMLSDPITKGFLSKYGNVSMVGYYEIANRMVQIFRALLVNANQVLVPTFARLEKLDPEKVSSAYIASYQIVFYLTIPGLCLLAISAPLISEILIGRYEPFFVWSMIVLCAGWLINTLSVPAYFATMGTGNMKGNVISHVAMTAVNVLLIYAFGYLWGGIGIVLAWSVALAIGGVILNMMHYRAYKIALRNAIPEASRLLTALCLFGLAVAYGIWGQLPRIESSLMNELAWTNPWASIMAPSVMVVIFALIIGVPMWTHPLRRKLWGLAGPSRSTRAT